MPIKNCSENGKPGKKFGDSGKCYTYTPNNEQSLKEAKKKALKQGIRIEGPEKFKQIMENDANEDEDLDDDEVFAALYEETENLAIASLIANSIRKNKK